MSCRKVCMVLVVLVLYVASMGRVFDFFEMNHPAVVCSGYTRDHLPRLNKAVLERKEDANVASLAARIAFSSFTILGCSR